MKTVKIILFNPLLFSKPRWKVWKFLLVVGVIIGSLFSYFFLEGFWKAMAIIGIALIGSLSWCLKSKAEEKFSVEIYEIGKGES